MRVTCIGDVAGIWLYFVKDVRFLALLYVVLLVLAVKGLLEWRKAHTATGATADEAAGGQRALIEEVDL